MNRALGVGCGLPSPASTTATCPPWNRTLNHRCRRLMAVRPLAFKSQWDDPGPCLPRIHRGAIPSVCVFPLSRRPLPPLPLATRSSVHKSCSSPPRKCAPGKSPVVDVRDSEEVSRWKISCLLFEVGRQTFGDGVVPPRHLSSATKQGMVSKWFQDRAAGCACGCWGACAASVRRMAIFECVSGKVLVEPNGLK